MSPNIAPSSPPGGSAKLVVVAAVLALVAIVLINVYIEYVKRVSAEGTTIRYRLTTTLRPGERIRERDVQEVRLPARYEDAFSGFLDPTEMQKKISAGELVRRTGEQGHFVSASLFEDANESGLDESIGEGMLLYALSVNSRTTVGGLRPGMYIDIFAPFRGSGPTPVVLPVMERVKVVTVGSVGITDDQANRRITSYQTVGIEVTPQAAIKLSMIERVATGPFEIALRKRSDERNHLIVNMDPQTRINPRVLDMLPTMAPTTAGL